MTLMKQAFQIRNETKAEPSRAVLGAIAVLEAFGRERGTQTLAQLNQQLGIPKATLLRHVKALVQTGYLILDQDRKTYSLGPAILTLSRHFLAQYESLLAGRQLLQALAEDTGETAHIGVLHDRDVVYLDIAESPQRVRAYVSRGDHLPAHCVAAGKAILAYSDPEVVAAVCRGGMKALTRRTITSPAAFQRELETVRRRGYAVNLGEWTEDVGATSAPVFMHSGRVVGAMGVAGPISRLNGENIDAVGRVARQHAKRASQMFGGLAAE